MPNGPNEQLDCSDYPTPDDELNKQATKRAIGWMRRFRARIASDIEGWGYHIGGDRNEPIEHDVAEAMLKHTIEGITEHIWEMPLFDFLGDKELAAEAEPKYARLIFALEEIENQAQKRNMTWGEASQRLMDIKAIAGAAATGQDFRRRPWIARR